MKIITGPLEVQEMSKRIGAPVADLVELKAIPADRRVPGQLFFKTDDQSLWRFHSSSVLTGDDLITATPGAGSGRFLRCPGHALLRIPITEATADAAVTFTTPAGCLIQMLEFAWLVTADWTGGAASTIGISSNKTGYTTKGDLLGGVAGDAAATLVASSGLAAMGTIGAQWGTIALRRPFWKPTENLRHDRITSDFTAGTGFQLVSCIIHRHDGA